jgi:SAM-dependent methyltransferase
VKAGSSALISPQLLQALEAAAEKSNADWMASLDSRKLAELEFHDHDRDIAGAALDDGDSERQTANKKYYSTVRLSLQYVHDWIAENARGRVFLDYACGNGEHTIEAARAGAALAVGLDISPISVANCRRFAAAAGVADRTRFVQGDCENTGLPANSFDTVLCSGMLHHLDLGYAFPELRRIMKPGGLCLAIEALNYNPVIKLYRLLTPGMRTEWEKHHILSHKHLRFARWFFDVQNVRYWHLTSVATTALRNTPLFRPALAVANALDRILLRVPPISLMAWMFSFELKKPETA